jgi:hypothetical protein
MSRTIKERVKELLECGGTNFRYLGIYIKFMAGDASRKNGKKGGKPKGAKSKKTLDKEIVLERFRQRTYQVVDKLFNAQFALSSGMYKMLRPYMGSDGLPHTEVIRDEKAMEELVLNGVHGKDYLLVEGSAPDNKAISNMLDRAFGKPTESIEHSGKDGAPLLIKLDK